MEFGALRIVLKLYIDQLGVRHDNIALQYSTSFVNYFLKNV